MAQRRWRGGKEAAGLEGTSLLPSSPITHPARCTAGPRGVPLWNFWAVAAFTEALVGQLWGLGFPEPRTEPYCFLRVPADSPKLSSAPAAEQGRCPVMGAAPPLPGLLSHLPGPEGCPDPVSSSLSCVASHHVIGRAICHLTW